MSAIGMLAITNQPLDRANDGLQSQICRKYATNEQVSQLHLNILLKQLRAVQIFKQVPTGHIENAQRCGDPVPFDLISIFAK